jgi:hypothetical protein
VTRLLDAAAAGDRQAAADLLPLVYDELRQPAAARMAAEAPGHTLDTLALVREAYLRLVGDQQFDGRGHFFAAAEANQGSESGPEPPLPKSPAITSRASPRPPRPSPAANSAMPKC